MRSSRASTESGVNLTSASVVRIYASSFGVAEDG